MRFHKNDSPLYKKSDDIRAYWQRQCDNFNFVSFCVSDKFFSAMIVRPGTVHCEILNANMGFQIDSHFIEKVIIVQKLDSGYLEGLDLFKRRIVERPFHIFLILKFFMVPWILKFEIPTE